jgi:hypothetical protein
MEAMNWDNVECIPSPQEMVGSGVGWKFAARKANISAYRSEEIVQKSGSKRLILQLD